MYEFLKFFHNKVRTYPMHLEIYYSHIMDWCIQVYKEIDGKRINIVDVQEADLELAFADAQVKLKTWLLENEGGY